MSGNDETAQPVAFFWPYLFIVPFPFAVAMAALGISTAKALNGSVVSNMLMGLFLTYLALSVPCLLFAWQHRRLYRASGQHRLGPLLGLAMGISLPVVLLLLAMPGQQVAPTGRDIALLVLMVVGGLVALALIGFAAVWLIDRWRMRGRA